MRLLLIVLLIMLPSFSVLTGVGYYFSKQALSQSVDESVAAIGTDYAHRVQASTNEIVIFVQELANNSSILRGNDREQIVKALADGMKRSDKFTGLNYGDLNGYVLRAQGDIYYLGDREYYQKAIRTQKVAISDPLISKGSGRISLAIAVPVIVNGDLQGILQATVPLDSLNDIVKDIKFKDSGYGIIAAKSGVIISDAQHPELNGILSLAEKEIKPDLNIGITELDENLISLFQMTVESGKQKKVIHTFLSKDKPLLSVFTPIDLLGEQRWILIITAPEEEVTREIWALGLIFMVVSLVCILIGAGAVIVFSARFAQPIQIIRDDCMRLTRGDLSEPERKIFSHDEIGQLAKGFQQMRVNLRNMMQELEIKNTSLEGEIIQREEAQRILAVSEEKFNKAFHDCSCPFK